MSKIVKLTYENEVVEIQCDDKNNLTFRKSIDNGETFGDWEPLKETKIIRNPQKRNHIIRRLKHKLQMYDLKNN
jgi:hypothetical protein